MLALKSKEYKPRKLKKLTAFDVFLVIFMTVVCVITLYPFLHVLALSLNDATDSIRGGIHVLPREFTFQNYIHIFSGGSDLPHAFFISVARTIIGTVTGVMACAVLAYVLSRKNFVFKRLFSTLLVVTMYVSGGLIPWFLLINDLNLNDSFWVYIIPTLIAAFNVIVIRSYMEQLPAELEESAKMDGASEWTTFIKIILPLCVPVLATVALFIAVGQWNSWFDTFLFNRTSPELWPLQYILMAIMDNASVAANVNAVSAEQMATRVSPVSIRMAVTIVATVPILMVYPFLQKYFVSGLTLGAVKS